MSKQGIVPSRETIEALRDFAFAYYSEHEGPSESEHKALDLVEALDKDIACASQPLADPAPERPSDTRTLTSCVRCGLAFAPEMLSELPSGPLCTDCLCESAAAQMPPPPEGECPDRQFTGHLLPWCAIGQVDCPRIGYVEQAECSIRALDGDLARAAQAAADPISNCMCGHCQSWADHGGGMGWCSEHNTMTVSGHSCKHARSKAEYAEPAGEAEAPPPEPPAPEKKLRERRRYWTWYDECLRRNQENASLREELEVSNERAEEAWEENTRWQGLYKQQKERAERLVERVRKEQHSCGRSATSRPRARPSPTSCTGKGRRHDRAGRAHPDQPAPSPDPR